MITPSSFGIKTAALTASECPSILLRRIGLAVWGLEWISAAMVPTLQQAVYSLCRFSSSLASEGSADTRSHCQSYRSGHSGARGDLSRALRLYEHAPIESAAVMSLHYHFSKFLFLFFHKCDIPLTDQILFHILYTASERFAHALLSLKHIWSCLTCFTLLHHKTNHLFTY